MTGTQPANSSLSALRRLGRAASFFFPDGQPPFSNGAVGEAAFERGVAERAGGEGLDRALEARVAAGAADEGAAAAAVVHQPPRRRARRKGRALRDG